MAHWRDHAACRPDPAWTNDQIQAHTALFFPGRGTDYRSPNNPTKQAKAICAACPVRTECLDTNLDEHHGIFGGLSEQQRRVERRRRNRTPRARIDHGTDRGYQAHRNNGETPCDACRQAHSTKSSAKRKETAT